MTVSAHQVLQMRKAIGDTMGDEVSVETCQGISAYGPILAAAVTVTCNIESKRRLVTAPDGKEVVSELTLHVASEDESTFTPESRVTTSTRVSTVIAVNPHAYRGSVAYVEVNCA